MPKRTIILACCLTLCATMAQSQAQAQHGMQDPGPCRRDAARLCRKALDQGDAAVLTCLKDNAANLSKRCHGILTRAGKL